MRTSAAQLESARKRVAEAEAQVKVAIARLVDAKAAPERVGVSQAQAKTASADIQQLEAMVKQAELEVSYTKIYAPESGRVTRKTVEEGAYLQVGQARMAIVPSNMWVIANFKETQLTYMRPGQPVDIRVDTYPHKIFKGHIDSIQAGAGARFSLLPPENATGNYVKVVQRIPVKIVFDESSDPNHLLAPGMSVVAKTTLK
jgi:membrane fusion protein (multidrug efflux system)